MNTSFHLSPHLFFFLFSLCSPSPVSHPALLRSLLAYFCVSLSLPHFVSLLSLNDSASPSVTPPLCSPSLSPSFPPHQFLPPADDAWCDEDWLRGSQGEENRRYVLQWREGGGGGGGGDGGGGKKNEEEMGTDNNVRESAYKGLRGDCTNMHCNTLAFIESITTPIIMQITIYTQRDGAKPASYYKP